MSVSGSCKTWPLSRVHILCLAYLSPSMYGCKRDSEDPQRCKRFAVAPLFPLPVDALKRDLQDRAVTAEERQREAECLAESAKGQLEGLGTFDRLTAGMLEGAQEELRHLRVQVGFLER